MGNLGDTLKDFVDAYKNKIPVLIGFRTQDIVILGAVIGGFIILGSTLSAMIQKSILK